MENNNIIENNKLIALFMGLSIWQGWGSEEMESKHFITLGTSPNETNYNVKNLQYNTSWDWLMPVVEKIEYSLPDDMCIIIEYKNCTIPILANSFNFGKEGFDIIEYGDTKIQATYKAVVEFIKWHNEQKLSHIDFDENGDNVIV